MEWWRRKGEIFGIFGLGREAGYLYLEKRGGFLELGFGCGVLWILGYLVRLVERCGWVVEVVSTCILGFLEMRVFDGFG